jgi:hypothetical protein
MRKIAIVVTLASSAALVAACASKKPNPPMTVTVSTDAGFGAAETGAPVAPEASDAGVAAAPPDAGAPPGVVGSPAEALIDGAIDLAIGTAALKSAPKMDKDGVASHSTLAEGGHFSMMINLAPNRCYTIIAHSPTGAVSQLDLKLFGPPFFNIEAGKSATADKNTPVIGKGAQALCPIIPLAVPYKVDVAATKGAGRIGVQVYARSK